MNEWVCGVDMGTTTVKAVLMDENGRVAGLAQAPALPLTVWQGFLSFDAEAHQQVVFDVVRRARAHAGVAPGGVAAIALSSQRATVVPIGPDGCAAGPALSWQDSSGDADMQALAERVGRACYVDATGLPPSCLWSLAKCLRLRRECPAFAGHRIRFALLHDYTLSRFGADGLLTDASNASVTGLMDVRSRTWSEPLLNAAGMRQAQWPEIRPAATPAGRCSAGAAAACGVSAGTPLVVGGGDQQCATLGAGALEVGDAALCLGTAAVLSCPLRAPVVRHGGGFFCTAHVVPDRWVLEGLHASFGGAVQWAMRMLACDSRAAFDALVAEAPPGAEGVVFLPFLAGAASPDFDASRRAVFAGMGLAHTRAHMARAVIEGIACDLRRILDTAAQWAPLRRLLVSGGGLPGPAARQVFATLAGYPLHWAEDPQTTQLGTAMLAWTGVGKYGSLAEAAMRMAAPFTAPVSAPTSNRADAVWLAYRRCLDAVYAAPAAPRTHGEPT